MSKQLNVVITFNIVLKAFSQKCEALFIWEVVYSLFWIVGLCSDTFTSVNIEIFHRRNGCDAVEKEIYVQKETSNNLLIRGKIYSLRQKKESSFWGTFKKEFLSV